MSGINKIMILGRAGRDGELRYSANGKPQLEFSVAVDGWGKDSKPTWFNVKMFGDRAEKVAQYVTKGDQVFVEGRHEMREWESNGEKKSRWEVVASDIQLLGGSRNEANAGPRRAQAKEEEFDADDLPFE